jgi:hypothetical protein
MEKKDTDDTIDQVLDTSTSNTEIETISMDYSGPQKDTQKARKRVALKHWFRSHIVPSTRATNSSRRSLNTMSEQVRESLKNISSSRNIQVASKHKTVEQTSSRGITQAMSEQWHGVVEQYSAHELSKETDRLPVLSGLAKRASPILGQYLCGLWLDTLIPDLIWIVPSLNFELGRAEKYTGPTWAWFSVKGPVKYFQDLDDYGDQIETFRRVELYSQIADNSSERNAALLRLRQMANSVASLQKMTQMVQFSCNISPVSENAFGEVSTGSLNIKGHLQCATLNYEYFREGPCSVKTHDPLKYQLEVHNTEVESNLQLLFFADYVLSEGPHRIPDGAALSLLLVHPHVCLVLKQRESESTFQRIGLVKQPSGLLFLYNLDWMKRSALKSVTID